ncbi:XRE family transcriptional regulator, partial [Escherichia coli]|nr:XRE family transcriptional regulator [Escherichia coli]
MKWIKALNLQQWADSIPAKVIFPALIADLIRATANSITEIRFPNGDKGQVRGYDGV